MLRLLLQEFRFRRNGIIGWGIGLALFGAMYTSLFPSVADQMAGLADLAQQNGAVTVEINPNPTMQV